MSRPDQLPHNTDALNLQLHQTAEERKFWRVKTKKGATVMDFSYAAKAAINTNESVFCKFSVNRQDVIHRNKDLTNHLLSVKVIPQILKGVKQDNPNAKKLLFNWNTDPATTFLEEQLKSYSATHDTSLKREIHHIDVKNPRTEKIEQKTLTMLALCFD